jgi:hypothetical protein
MYYNGIKIGWDLGWRWWLEVDWDNIISNVGHHTFNTCLPLLASWNMERNHLVFV